MRSNPLKWLIKLPVYIIFSPIWLMGNFFMVIEVTINWAFSSDSWENAHKRWKIYKAIHSDY
jgi:hypothetical protein